MALNTYVRTWEVYAFNLSYLGKGKWRVSHIWGLPWLQNEFKTSPGHLGLSNRLFNKRKINFLNFNRIKNESVQEGSPLRGVSGAEAELLPGTHKVLINSPEPKKRASVITNESVLGITGRLTYRMGSTASVMLESLCLLIACSKDTL